mgnify:CR=1 FL=1
MRFFAFPTVSQMCNVTEEDLRDCKTGFRAPYIVDAVQKTADGQISEAALKAADTAECEKMLTKIKGVGSKVANCCMLFGLDKRDAFPVDVWIKRIMEQLYFSGKGKRTKKKLRHLQRHVSEAMAAMPSSICFFTEKQCVSARKIKKLKKYNLIIKNKRYFQLSVDKQKAECYLKSIDVSTPLKRVLTRTIQQEGAYLSGYRIG